uniref:Uncharacterized protein n=1 Tax=Macrostomum lignano TaxID=282301 RepID=A0A1I8FM54_9PLAT
TFDFFNNYKWRRFFSSSLLSKAFLGGSRKIPVQLTKTRPNRANLREQLEAEKKGRLGAAPRSAVKYSTDLGESQLQEKAKELFNKIYSLEGDKYDLEQRFKALNMEGRGVVERNRRQNDNELDN